MNAHGVNDIRQTEEHTAEPSKLGEMGGACNTRGSDERRI